MSGVTREGAAFRQPQEAPRCPRKGKPGIGARPRCVLNAGHEEECICVSEGDQKLALPPKAKDVVADAERIMASAGAPFEKEPV
jgi:hypothetical protein